MKRLLILAGLALFIMWPIPAYSTEPPPEPPFGWKGTVCTRHVVRTPSLEPDAVMLVRTWVNGKELDAQAQEPSFYVDFIGRGGAVRVTTTRKLGPATIYMANLRKRCSTIRVSMERVQ